MTEKKVRDITDKFRMDRNIQLTIPYEVCPELEMLEAEIQMCTNYKELGGEKGVKEL